MTVDPAMALILCIDDEQQLLIDLVDELQRAGYAVLAADSASAAYAVLEDRQPDLILCDISMPDADGYSVLETLRGRPGLADVPFIFLTALASRADVIEGRQRGSDDYLTKPVDYDLLLATVSSRLDHRRRVRQAFGLETERLQRHAQQTIRAHGQTGMQLATLALDRVGSGLVIIDEKCTILEINALATSILAQDEALKNRNGLLVVTGASKSAFDAALSRLQAEEDSASALVLDRGARQPLLIQLARLAVSAGDSRFVVMITDPEQPPALSPQLAIELYGLTPTEAKIAVAIASGKRPDEVSAAFAIAQSTINFHLNNIFRKTGTARQSDLVALLVRMIVADPNRAMGASDSQAL